MNEGEKMSYLKMCSLAIAAVVVAAVVAAAPATATVLCKTETSPCTSRYGAGTEVNFHLRPETISKTEELPLTETKFIIECEESTFKFKTTNEGGATQAVTANTEAFTFGKCWLKGSSYTSQVVLKKPSLELDWVSGANARITAKGVEITVVYLGFDCVYGIPGGGSTGIGELRGGKPAQVWLSMQLARLSGSGCPEKMIWLGEYEVTAPNPLYVAAS